MAFVTEHEKQIHTIEDVKNIKPSDIVMSFRYYNGENENPYHWQDARSTYWICERLASNHTPQEICDFTKEFITDFCSCLLPIDAPLSQKVIANYGLFCSDNHCGANDTCLNEFFSFDK